ncbi:MAG: hypothetical protein HWN67_06315 [Candidatus Helarchaeota archaeon]|nr:hypothetical protein [Candidatus Helarchaeota archaeon]
MNDIPKNFKDSFTKLEKTIQTKHIIEIIKEFESLLKEIILNEKISCETDYFIDVTQSTENDPKKIRVNLVIPNQTKPKILVIIKFIIDYPEVLMNYMIEVTMLREYFGKNVKIIYILHDSNQKFFEESIYQTLIKNMIEQNYLDELLFLPKDFNKFLDIIKS